MRTEGGPFDTPLSSPPLPIIGRGVFTENILVQNTIFFFPKVPPLPLLGEGVRGGGPLSLSKIPYLMLCPFRGRAGLLFQFNIYS